MSKLLTRCPALLLVAATLLPASVARADSVVSELVRDTPISAYGGAVAWSSYDEPSKRYALVIRQGDVTRAAKVAAASRPFDVSLGPDVRGRVVALYTRCRSTGRGCDVYRYDLRARRERKLRSVSSPSLDEAWPAQWRDRVTFARRARTHVIDGFHHRPDPRGRGPLLACDIPYVKTLSSAAPSRRLDRSQCGSTVGMAIRGETIIHVAGVNQGGAGSESQVRRLRARGGRAIVLARTGGGEGGYSPFVAPSLSASAVWLTRTGVRQGVTRGFLRIDLVTRALTTIPANLNLAGAVARDERGRFWYVQGPEPDFDYPGGPAFCHSPLEPCRLVRASASPFSTTPRALPARLSFAGGPSAFLTTFAADPPTIAGDLAGAIVRKGAVIGRVPLAGVALDLLRTDDVAHPGPFTATGLTTTTDAAGHWSFALANPPPQIVLAVRAAALKVASTVVSVTALARVSLQASGMSLAGTVAPAQPGRTVEVGRLIVDERGRLPDGRQVCMAPPTARTCADEAWSTVARVPLDAAGTAFSAVVAEQGTYRARLSFEGEQPAGSPAYGGSSSEVRVPG